MLPSAMASARAMASETRAGFCTGARGTKYTLPRKAGIKSWATARASRVLHTARTQKGRSRQSDWHTRSLTAAMSFSADHRRHRGWQWKAPRRLGRLVGSLSFSRPAGGRLNSPRSSWESSRASARSPTVARCGSCLSSPSSAAIPRRLSSARSASSSCVRPAVWRNRRSNCPNESESDGVPPIRERNRSEEGLGSGDCTP